MAKKVNDVSFEEAFQFIRKVGRAAHKYGSTSGRKRSSMGYNSDWDFLDESNPDDLALLDASVLHPNILIESDEMFWMSVDDQGEVENYSGDDANGTGNRLQLMIKYLF